MKIDSPVALTRLLLQENTCTGQIGFQFVEKCTGWLHALGFTVSHVELKGLVHILATIGPAHPKVRVALVGHYDTVSVGTGWQRGPHDATEENGIIFGRGASDMKSGDAAMIFAAIAAAPHGVHSTVFLPADEETASEGMPALLETVPYSFDYCLCAEPTSKVNLGDCVKVGRRGVFHGKITLQGKSGHAAYAQTTANIVHELPRVISELSRGWSDECSGVETTLSITNLTTDSPAVNVIPGSVEVTFDCRFAPHRSLEDVHQEIVSRMTNTGVPFELLVTKRSKPYYTDESVGVESKQAKLIGVLVAAIKRVVNVTPALTCDGGTSDARFVAWQGVPTVEFGVPHGNMHGPDEWVEVKNIERLCEVYERALVALAKNHDVRC
jgi:succinyl-diaminopimelate desuccinylase